MYQVFFVLKHTVSAALKTDRKEKVEFQYIYGLRKHTFPKCMLVNRLCFESHVAASP